MDYTDRIVIDWKTIEQNLFIEFLNYETKSAFL